MAALTLENVTKRYGDFHAVKDVSLAVADGEFLVLLGPSGCGKTTTLRIVAGFVEPTSGRVRLGAREVTELPPWQRNAGLVFQSYALFPHLTAAENVAFGLEMRSVPAAEIAPRVAEALRLVRLGHLGDRLPRQLSGGQQQRVALARALVIRPRCLLLDEPLSNLDAQLRVEMRQEIRRIVKENGLTAVYVTHDQEEALAMADRMAILSRGRVAQVGTPEEVYRRPVTSEVARFIGETNLLAVEIIGQDAATVSVLSAAGVFTGILGDPHQKATAGQPAELSIRPEAWRPATVGEANAVTGVVVEKIYLGQRAQLTLRTQQGLLRIVIINPPGDLTTGHELTVAVAPSDVVVLPRK